MKVTKMYIETTVRIQLDGGKEISVGEHLNSFGWDDLLTLVTGYPIEVIDVDTYTVSFNVLAGGIHLIECKVERPTSLTHEDLLEYIRRVNHRVSLVTASNQLEESHES